MTLHIEKPARPASPPFRERRGLPAAPPIRLAHIVSVSGSHAVAILERSSEASLRAKDPRIQIGAAVKILTPGASVMGLVSSVSTPMGEAPITLAASWRSLRAFITP